MKFNYASIVTFIILHLLVFETDAYAGAISYPVSSEIIVVDRTSVTVPLEESFNEAVSGDGSTSKWLIKSKRDRDKLFIKISAVGDSEHPEYMLTKVIWYYILPSGEKVYLTMKSYDFKKGYFKNRLNINNLLRDTRDIVSYLVDKQPFIEKK